MVWMFFASVNAFIRRSHSVATIQTFENLQSVLLHTKKISFFKILSINQFFYVLKLWRDFLVARFLVEIFEVFGFDLKSCNNGTK